MHVDSFIILYHYPLTVYYKGNIKLTCVVEDGAIASKAYVEFPAVITPGEGIVTHDLFVAKELEVGRNRAITRILSSVAHDGSILSLDFYLNNCFIKLFPIRNRPHVPRRNFFLPYTFFPVQFSFNFFSIQYV